LLFKHVKEEAGGLELSDYKQGDKLIPWKIVASHKGVALEGLRYEQLIPLPANTYRTN
jgi:isoleucyl-tRNA synthetase